MVIVMAIEGAGRKAYPTEVRIVDTEEMSEALITALIILLPDRELDDKTLKDRRASLKRAVQAHQQGEPVTLQHHPQGLRLIP